ncbi:urea transporter [Embleya sp. NPDC050154]|uniref:urea transporter n=1 Tax=Embleya sp. NPDC050154 TaxID=3363988 RepID=UPI0037A18E49
MGNARRTIRPPLTRQTLTGVVPNLSARCAEHPALDFLTNCLRGVGMAGFLGNPLTGTIMLVTVWWVSPWFGALVSVGVVASTATAALLGFDRADARLGLYGFNGALTGAGAGVLLAPSWSPTVLALAAAAAAVTALTMGALMCFMTRTWGVPPLALPMNGVLMMLVIALQQADVTHLRPYVTPPDPTRPLSVDPTLRDTPVAIAGTDSLTDHVRAVLHGISQLFFLESVPAALVFLVAITLFSRLLAALALLGSAAAVATATLMGFDGFLVYVGVVGLNGALVCMAIGGVFLTPSVKSAVLGIAAAAGSCVVFSALNAVMRVWGLPSSLSLAYCLIVPVVTVLKSKVGGVVAAAPAPTESGEGPIETATPQGTELDRAARTV